MKIFTKNNKKGMQYMKPKKFNVKKKTQAPSCEHNKNYVLQPVIQLLHISFVWHPYPSMVGYGHLDTTDLSNYSQIWECWH
jgi:hypothetical protein